MPSPAAETVITVELVPGNGIPGRAVGVFGLLTSNARIIAARRLGFLFSLSGAIARLLADILARAGNAISPPPTPQIIG
jgi:hypothetical protein